MNVKTLLNRFVAIVAVVGLVWGAIVAPAQAFKQNDVNALKEDKQCPMCDLKNADLHGVDLTGSVLFASDMTEANLENADLRDANLYNVTLTNADLTGAKIDEKTVLIGANLTGAKVDENLLKLAKLQKTILPDGHTETNIEMGVK